MGSRSSFMLPSHPWSTHQPGYLRCSHPLMDAMEWTQFSFSMINTNIISLLFCQESKCNVTVITLGPLAYNSSGVYRCEVSSERPHFKTVYKSQNMSVFGGYKKYFPPSCCNVKPGLISPFVFPGLPKNGPIIEGIKETYFLGDYITGNCTSSPSNPAAQIQWFINDKKVGVQFTCILSFCFMLYRIEQNRQRVQERPVSHAECCKTWNRDNKILLFTSHPPVEKNDRF